MQDGDGGKSAPRITGLSTPVGSSSAKKQESPAQRSAAINQQNQPKAKPQAPKKTVVNKHRPVTQEEVDKFRKNRKTKRLIVSIAAILLIVSAGIAGYSIYTKHKTSKYLEFSGIYNDNIPAVVVDNGKYYLVSQKGKKISSDYEYISDTIQNSIFAISRDDVTYTHILDLDGNELFSTENLLEQINYGKNYIFGEDGKYYILDEKGQKISEKSIVGHYSLDQEYALVENNSSIAIIDNQGKETFSRIKDNFEVMGFSYAHNRYEDSYYCAITYGVDRKYSISIYNCKNGKEIKKIEDSGVYSDFYDAKTTLLQSGGKYYYFFSNDILFSSDYPSEELFAGIIETTNEEGETRYFDPKKKELQEDYPSNSLVAQNKFDNNTTIDENCRDFQKDEEHKLIKLCDNIYLDNKLQKLDYGTYNFDLLPKELSKYLSYLDKNYIVRSQKDGGAVAFYDIDKKAVVEGLDALPYYNLESKSSFVRSNYNSETVDYYNIITGITISVEPGASATLGTNYLTIRNGNEASYINKNGEKIYTVKEGN